MATMLREPETRSDDERTIFVADHHLEDQPLEEEQRAEYERERYDEQILAGLITF